MLEKKYQLDIKDIGRDYDRIYSTCGLRANSAYYKWILRLLSPKPNTRLLDVSCGEGILLRQALRLPGNIKTYGLDISAKAINKALANSRGSVFLLADGLKIPFSDDTFDYVTCLGSLEHYLDPEQGLREIRRVAKEDARFCFVLPNSLSIDLFLEVAKTGARPTDNFQIIERTATKMEWIGLLEKNGFEVKAVHASNL